MKNLQYIAVAVISLIILVCTHAFLVRGEGFVPSAAAGEADDPVENAAENAAENGPESDVIQQETEEIVTESMQLEEVSLPDEETRYAGYVMEQFEEDTNDAAKRSGTARTGQGSKLEGTDAAAYQILREKICQVADGEETATSWEITAEALGIAPESYHEADLGVEIMLDEAGRLNQEAVSFVLARSGLHIMDVMNALVADLPFELYWFDKTAGLRPNYYITYGTDENGEDYINSLESCTIGFAVSKDYSLSGTTHTYETDPVKTGRASLAAENAGKIVEENAALSDFEKLEAYKDFICNSVSYNYTPAESTDDGTEILQYGDPWQLVWVFDGDNTTNVVCEGYSKAFQYLCDLSTFDAEVECLSVTGFTNAGVDLGGHMWNLITMSDESAGGDMNQAGDTSADVQETGRSVKTYLADITNSDREAIGAGGELFMVGYSGEEDSSVSYTITCRNDRISYVYDEETKNQYAPDVLKLSETDYTPGKDAHDLHFVEAVPASCKEDGTIAYWKCEACGKMYSDENAVTRLGEEDLTDPAFGHKYTVKWNWKENSRDSYTSEATFVCSKCNDTQTVSVREIQKQENAAEIIYTARTIFDNTEYTAELIIDKVVEETGTDPNRSNSGSAGTGNISVGNGAAGGQKAQLSSGIVCMAGGQQYRVTGAAGASAGDSSGTVLFTKAKNKKNVTVPDTVVLSDGKTYKVIGVAAKAFTGKKIKKVTIGANVFRLAKNAFAKSKAKTIVLKTKLLSKASVKGSLKKSKVKKIQVKAGKIKENKKLLKQYKKYFTGRNAGRSVTVC